MCPVQSVNYVSGSYLGITGGSGEIRTRDQRIKRSRGSLKSYINQWSKRPKNECAIDCAIENRIKIGDQLEIRTRDQQIKRCEIALK